MKKTKAASSNRPNMRNYRKKSGLPPGSLVYTGNIEHETDFDAFVYDDQTIDRIESSDVKVILDKLDTARNNWINVNGLTNTQLISELGDHHTLHPLLLEDVLNTEAMPKIENYGDVLFANLKMLRWNADLKKIEGEQISMVLGEKYLLSFQERKGDVFDAVRERMLSGLSKVRNKGIDFLAYTLIDKIIDNYFLVLEAIEDHIEDIENELIKDSGEVTPIQLMHIKKQLILLRKFVYPLRDEIRKLQHDETHLIDRNTIKYINDLYDHLQNIIQNLESFRDTVSNLMDLYSSTVSNKLNVVMKTLTVVGAIFIPLTFIVGVYGMNFDHMPELHYAWAYPVVWLIMTIVAAGMVLYMKSKNWF